MKQRLLLQLLILNCIFQITASASCAQQVNLEFNVDSLPNIECILDLNLTTYPDNSIEWKLLPGGSSIALTNSLNLTSLVTGINQLECNFILNASNSSSESLNCPVNVTINSLPSLSFSPDPIPIIIYPSGTTIECIAAGGFPDSTFAWFDSNGGSLSTSSTLSFNSNQDVIGDNKEFICNASNSVGVVSRNVLITVMPNPPSVSINPLSTTVFIGDQTVLTCTATSPLSSVTYSYTWHMNEIQLTSITNGITVNGGVLTIADTRTVNNGLYVCNATVLNSLPGTNSTQLTVISPSPTVSISPMPVGTHTVGSQVELTCVVTPQPEDGLNINILWSNSSLGSVSGANGSILTLSSIELNDEGVYICTASVGNSENVSASYTLEITPLAPTVKVEVNSSTPLIGDYVMLFCNFTDTSGSSATPVFTWSSNQSIISGQMNQAYILGPVTLSDTSSYACSVSIDGSETGNSSSVDIMVYDLPRITSIPTSPQHVIEGESVGSLNCEAEGTPNPYVKWLDKNGKMYPNPLDLSDLTNQMNGTFTCNANNSANPQGVTDSIEIVIVPPAPVLTVETSEPNPIEGILYTLTCFVSSSLPFDLTLSSYLFTWRKASDPIPILVQTQSYSFTPAAETNGTSFVCTATVAGSAVGTAYTPILSLQRVPMITNFSIPDYLYIGISYSVTCEANGIPQPDIYLTNSAGETFNTNVKELNYFTQADAGMSKNYTCIGNNTHGTVNKSQSFEILKPSIYIVFTSDPDRVINGHSFVLNCSFTTDPDISLDNTQFTFKMNQSVINSPQTVSPDSNWASLTIDQFSSGSEAQFSCFISIQNQKLTAEEFLTIPESPTPDPLLFVAVGVSVAAVILLMVFVCLILLLIVCCLRGRRKRDIVPHRTGDYIGLNTPIAEQSVFSYPISVLNYSDTFDALHEDNHSKLKEQYQQLTTIKGNTEEAKRPVNATKNRYPDVLAYDHSRVIISKFQGTDYINANYMNGFGKINAYIAAQGPLGPPKAQITASPSTANGGTATPQLNTVNDFWRMVWELNITTIVMLTNLIESNRIKCALYWPEDTQNYGRIRVRKVEESQFCDYIIRKFSIQRIQVRSGDSETRQITQFHFVAWPDHGVPLFPIAMIQFVKLVRSYINQNGDETGAPDLVHCSAGVGRTGTFICLDIILQQLATGDTCIDIWKETAKLRKQRNHMIQEYLQYEFVHQAINEHIQFGDTECSAANFPQMVTKLNEITDDNPYKVGMSRLEIQFKKLQLRVIQSQHRDAMLNENAGKNRFINTMPFDHNRVKLNPLPGIVGSDYINASYIDSDKTHWAFIATQGPLKTTMEDFCRLVIEKRSNVIIMLSENSEDKTEDYFSFSQTHYGSYHLQTVKKHMHNDYVHREMIIRDDNEKNDHHIHHFQLTKLLAPTHSHKDCAKSMLSLITGVTMTLQPDEPKKGPMVVHCGGGNGMTGVFMTVYIIIQRLQYEDKVDVFNTVKRLRMQRVAMVQSVDQYDLCYRTVMEYLQSSP